MSDAIFRVFRGDATGGEAGLTYKWSAIRVPAGAAGPTFSANDSNAARQVVATFHKDGRYLFGCIISDGHGNTVKTDIQVEVTQTATSLRIWPSNQAIATNEKITFHATLYDQFGNRLRHQPAAAFSILHGSGTINATTGLFSSALFGTALIQADDDGLSATADVQVIA